MSENNFLTPVGRLVQGHPMKFQSKNMQGQPLTNKDGTPRVTYFAAIALPKTDPATTEFINTLHAIAQADFPQGHSQHSNFSWKYMDGDLPEHAQKEGFPGHYVVRAANGFAPKCIKDEGGTLVELHDESQIKRGHYVRFYVGVSGNGQTGQNQTAGLYINLSMVQWLAYGPEIQTGPDANEVFGNAPVALPPGASAAPLAGPPLSTPAQGAPQMGAPVQQPMHTGGPAPQQMPPATHQTPPIGTAVPPSAPGFNPHAPQQMPPSAHQAPRQQMPPAAGQVDPQFTGAPQVGAAPQVAPNTQFPNPGGQPV